MRNIEIEEFCLRIIENVQNHQPIEDDRVELKAIWPEPNSKTARKIAGQANAARNESFFWIIGLDEERGVLGIKSNELSNWWSKIQSFFDESVCPELNNINVNYNDKVLAVLYFHTDRAPYVVKNATGNTPHREVPWREANSTRTAHRSDLLKVLVPQINLPTLELLKGNIELFDTLSEGNTIYMFDIKLNFYVESDLIDPVIIPYHKCKIELVWDHQDSNPILRKIKLLPSAVNVIHQSSTVFRQPPPPKDSLTIDYTDSEIFIRGPGKIDLKAELSLNDLPSNISELEEMKINIHLNPINTEKYFRYTYSLKRIHNNVGQKLKCIWAI